MQLSIYLNFIINVLSEKNFFPLNFATLWFLFVRVHSPPPVEHTSFI